MRVKELAPEELWRSRFDSINDFERMLVREGTTIPKFFLHISKEEQPEKFRERQERTDVHARMATPGTLGACPPGSCSQAADSARFRVEPGERVALADLDPADTGGVAGEQATGREYVTLSERLSSLQERLHAEERRSLLIVLQGTDAAGKDGTIKHVLRGTNPAGVRVHSFKEPSNDELAHDFLWRYHQATPADGMIGVFNRSH